MITTNAKVKTPIGDGIVQGGFAVKDAQGDQVAAAVLVRMPVNDITRAQLSKSHCLTPHASRSALFVFTQGELL
jgi:hypothetical protein